MPLCLRGFLFLDVPIFAPFFFGHENGKQDSLIGCQKTFLNHTIRHHPSDNSLVSSIQHHKLAAYGTRPASSTQLSPNVVSEKREIGGHEEYDVEYQHQKHIGPDSSESF